MWYIEEIKLIVTIITAIQHEEMVTMIKSGYRFEKLSLRNCFAMVSLSKVM